MSTRLVICANDFPHSVMPAGSTPEQASDKCMRLRKDDPANIEHNEKFPSSIVARVYYHFHEVPEEE